MKRLSIRTLLLAFTTVVLALAGATLVSADSSMVIQIGAQGPPPLQQDYQQWQKPYHSAVWIPGHNEWQNGQYVWVGGYYGYPPHRHSKWIAPSYPHNQSGYSYRPGHWSN